MLLQYEWPNSDNHPDCYVYLCYEWPNSDNHPDCYVNLLCCYSMNGLTVITILTVMFIYVVVTV